MTIPNPILKKLGLSASDRAVILHAADIGNLQGRFLRKLAALKLGLTYLILHPTKDTPQLREVVRDSDWPCRVAEYETPRDPDLREAARATGVQIIRFRALRDVMPERGGS